MDALILSRIQFAVNVSFHILFPVINIALAWFVVYFRYKAGKTGDAGWLAAYRFWTKVFAVTFAIGVVSGVTMSFQFGTNWPGFMEKAGNIAGPLLGYEVLTAFFLEAGFLGIMLFGRERVSQKVHMTASVIVAVGTSISAFWILALDSWMQTPQGHWIDAEGVMHVKNWLEVIFNPSFPYRLTHKLLASALTASFLIIGLSAWQILKKTANSATPKVLKTGLTVAAVAIVLQVFAGDAHGLNTHQYQPAKLAAIEAVWHTEKPAPLTLIGWPNEQTQQTDYAVKVPYLGSLILTHSMDGEIKGLSEFADKPPVAPVFFAFRVMVGVGVLMLLVSWYGWYRFRKTRWQPQQLPKWLLYTFAGMTFSGWVATLSGWYVTEIGRQPFLVYGVLRTEDAVTKMVPSENIGLTLVMYLVLYSAMLLSYIMVLKYMAEHPEHDAHETGRLKAEER
ncbi:cytochrome ubiquinol oxidase subunit I [Neisseria dentiae]|uniref:Cytochrome ubiquinol oxidase subunit I n=1 Tax=Neisseria dentiae TaxID=194197 RepID=A0A1X3D9U3_9NEIS|nr:cytochrome ubiquinol oxidase subunit I [Neisseria dentiae]OSI16545.1 cytochrome ubiquinol oxidase subunit I [Neisseria dentiae]QMT44268.1 cytochrome ubiquinol oxidase subunit I [Neisseria dentiae]STZ49949.1 Cytochrome bd-II oxidase subunit 1 [Neisseria dentiae]STZ52882.1 Cytochrome bd-II oxidase subunit 1 [Neisseria dentiae]